MNDSISATVVARLTLRKPEKLRHRSLINALYDRGEALFCYPLRLTWRQLDAEMLASTFRDRVPEAIGSLQVMFTVPKRKQRHAVDRVLMRRRMREAYRLNRSSLRTLAHNAQAATISMSFVYISDKKCTYTKIQTAMQRLLAQVEQRLSSAVEHDS